MDQFAAWAATRPDIEAVVIVGSWARGNARPDSDVDLVVIAAQPESYQRDLGWVSLFGDAASVAHEDWGLVQSVRVH
jgi:predicted nucleotidyltransferase